MSATNANQWWGAYGNSPKRVTTTVSPWREDGFEYKYQWIHDRAKTAIAQWAESRKGQPPKASDPPFVVFLPDDQYPQSLFRLAFSYPFMKTAWAITSHRGNAPGPNGHTYYEYCQTPDFGDRLLRQIKTQVRSGRYKPGGLREAGIPKGNGEYRKLHIGNVEDRLVERAATLALVPIYEFVFSKNSFGFRPRLGTAHALAELNRKCMAEGRHLLCKTDIADAFGHVPHNRLMDTLRIWVKDADLTQLIERFIRRPGWRNREGKERVGIPQGGPLSPLLFNVYLDHTVDKKLERMNVRFIRWADDIMLVGKDTNELCEYRRYLEELLRPAGMKINKKKDETADLKKGETIEYLGLQVRLGETGILEYDLAEDAYLLLENQVRRDVVGQNPNVGWKGYQQWLRDSIQHTIGSWLESLAGAIPPETWAEQRRRIKGYFLGDPPNLLEGLEVPPRLQRALHCPSTADLNALYERARGHWKRRYNEALPDPYLRLGILRNAPAKHQVRTQVPEYIADGADIVPAPLAVVDAGPRPGAEVVDFRVRLLPF